MKQRTELAYERYLLFVALADESETVKAYALSELYALDAQYQPSYH
ncbi:hypothetical protein J6V86_01415 [bacterium]|nr:hypothetical protein [bacterium]